MVLHVFLALLAVLLFFFAGINNVYPLANDLIRALRAQIIQNQLQGQGFGPVSSLGIRRGPLRRCPEFLDMDLPVDHKCPALRIEVSSGVAGDHSGLENSDNVAATGVCVSKS
jgi:hypothetical protein